MCFFETTGTAVSYPAYHAATDTYDNPNISYQQLTEFGAAAFSCLLEMAQPL